MVTRKGITTQEQSEAPTFADLRGTGFNVTPVRILDELFPKRAKATVVERFDKS